VSKIETGRYSELLRRMLGQKGQEVVAGELSPEISPTFQLEAALPSLEWYYLKGVKALGFAQTIGANALAGGHARLTNPLGSGVLGIVTLAAVSATADITWAVALQEDVALLGSAGLGSARDGRWPIPAALTQSALLVSFTAAAGAVPTGAGALGTGVILSRHEAQYDSQVVVPPGFSLDWGSNTANVFVAIRADWFERPVAPLELS